ncbi:ATP-binding protein [Streptomyces halobius]|uniref:ATP-binding protein n=1 Tax=Streptomyces halobius TaxID=2879846 RepID=A0ABY4LZ55_9ACTN|nr:ATP-binding protein [Streptomyces halobius]UQA90784.1 ATP-binding protein [Streptomyces halobius]
MRRVLTAAAVAATAVALGSTAAAQAVSLPKSPDLNGVTALDPSGTLGGTVDGATQQATQIAEGAGNKAVEKAVPPTARTARTAGSMAKKTRPVARKAADNAVGSAESIVGETAKAATENGLPTAGLPTDALKNASLPPLG